MCLANLLTNAYVFAQLPLLNGRADLSACSFPFLPSSILLFCIGMIVPGPFVAHLLERYKRKHLFLNALIMLVLTSVAVLLLPEPYHVVSHVLMGLEGAFFGMMQIAMGSTIINDMLISAKRTKGDCIYAWMGRMGIPLGLLMGYLLSHHLPYPSCVWWSIIAPAAAFVLVAQTVIPVKAPVNMPVMALDRFFLPSSWSAMLMLFPAALGLGFMVETANDLISIVALVAGYALAYLCCILLPAKRFLFSRISLGYALLTLGFALIASPISSHLPLWLIPLMIGWGSAWVSASMLVRFVEYSEHCQRGTAQNTHLLIWSLSFAIGYLSASCCGW